MTNVQALKPVYQFAFDGDGEKPYPSALLGRTGDNGVKLLSYS
jgi:hypothetical protein